ncbi:MAG: SIS domain-containing protein [Candidatus Omnitrophota bacterium]
MNMPMESYSSRLVEALRLLPQKNIKLFFNEVLSVWRKNGQIFICGNGGSAANALHISNDLFYGIAKNQGKGIKIHALTANQPVVTCLANDISYGEVFSIQLDLLANSGDMLIALSGSGNSTNILSALKKAKEMKIFSVAILGYSGGAALKMADIPIHVPVHDMQISEDLQMIIGHALAQWLNERNPNKDK